MAVLILSVYGYSTLWHGKVFLGLGLVAHLCDLVDLVKGKGGVELSELDVLDGDPAEGAPHVLLAEARGALCAQAGVQAGVKPRFPVVL